MASRTVNDDSGVPAGDSLKRRDRLCELPIGPIEDHAASMRRLPRLRIGDDRPIGMDEAVTQGAMPHRPLATRTDRRYRPQPGCKCNNDQDTGEGRSHFSNLTVWFGLAGSLLQYDELITVAYDFALLQCGKLDAFRMRFSTPPLCHTARRSPVPLAAMSFRPAASRATLPAARPRPLTWSE